MNRNNQDRIDSIIGTITDATNLIDQLRSSLKTAVKMLESNPIVSPAHICGPDMMCDSLCQDYANWEMQIDEFKKLI